MCLAGLGLLHISPSISGFTQYHNFEFNRALTNKINLKMIIGL